METHMYDAIVKMKREGRVDEIVVREQKKEIWEKHGKRFSLEGDNLLWNGQRVPIQDELDDAIRLVHINENGKHCLPVWTLVDALAGKNWAMPPFAGGLQQACNL